ncbi:MAG: FAD-dependent oxidoreductase, partial [Acidimicrobiia bacterium]|nr:FAD-dependent oxidoreductase [Acidimicrobiia bacterium]
LTIRGGSDLGDARREARLHRALGPARGGHLVDRYGSEVSVLLAMIDGDPALAEPLSPELPYLGVEVVYAARYEMATTLDDILSRRTRARLRDIRATSAIAAKVAALVADDLEWDAARQAHEVETVRRSMNHELDAAALPHPFELVS